MTIDFMVNNKTDRVWYAAFQAAMQADVKSAAYRNPIMFADMSCQRILGKEAKPNYNLRHSCEREQWYRDDKAMRRQIGLHYTDYEALVEHFKHHEKMDYGIKPSIVNATTYTPEIKKGDVVKCLGIGYPFMKDGLYLVEEVFNKDDTLGLRAVNGGGRVRAFNIDFIVDCFETEIPTSKRDFKEVKLEFNDEPPVKKPWWKRIFKRHKNHETDGETTSDS